MFGIMINIYNVRNAFYTYSLILFLKKLVTYILLLLLFHRRLEHKEFVQNRGGLEHEAVWSDFEVYALNMSSVSSCKAMYYSLLFIF